MTGRPYAAIILAAGLSSRMKQFKPLLSIGCQSITDRLIATFLRNDVDVYLVTGNRGDELRQAIQNRNVTFVENKNYAEGMFSSVQSGVRAIGQKHKAFFLSPVDIPLVRPSTMRQLILMSDTHPDRIFYPVFRGKRGHPPLIPVALSPDIQKWEGEGGLKVFLDSYEAIATEVSVPDQYITRDIDTDNDYEVLVRTFPYYDVPTEEECLTILDDICKVSPDIRSHSIKVAGVAAVIGKALNKAGSKIDLAVVNAGALLHDIAKGQKKHASVGRQLLLEMSYSRIADIVSMHMYLPEDETQISLEAKIVYLADKFIEGDRLVTIEQRFAPSLQRFKCDPGIEARIRMRQQQALKVKAELEALVGYHIESHIFN